MEEGFVEESPRYRDIYGFGIPATEQESDREIVYVPPEPSTDDTKEINVEEEIPVHPIQDLARRSSSYLDLYRPVAIEMPLSSQEDDTARESEIFASPVAEDDAKEVKDAPESMERSVIDNVEYHDAFASDQLGGQQNNKDVTSVSALAADAGEPDFQHHLYRDDEPISAHSVDASAEEPATYIDPHEEPIPVERESEKMQREKTLPFIPSEVDTANDQSNAKEAAVEDNVALSDNKGQQHEFMSRESQEDAALAVPAEQESKEQLEFEREKTLPVNFLEDHTANKPLENQSDVSDLKLRESDAGVEENNRKASSIHENAAVAATDNNFENMYTNSEAIAALSLGDQNSKEEVPEFLQTNEHRLHNEEDAISSVPEYYDYDKIARSSTAEAVYAPTTESIDEREGISQASFTESWTENPESIDVHENPTETYAEELPQRHRLHNEDDVVTPAISYLPASDYVFVESGEEFAENGIAAEAAVAYDNTNYPFPQDAPVDALARGENAAAESPVVSSYEQKAPFEVLMPQVSASAKSTDVFDASQDTRQSFSHETSVDPATREPSAVTEMV